MWDGAGATSSSSATASSPPRATATQPIMSSASAMMAPSSSAAARSSANGGAQQINDKTKGGFVLQHQHGKSTFSYMHFPPLSLIGVRNRIINVSRLSSFRYATLFSHCNWDCTMPLNNSTACFPAVFRSFCTTLEFIQAFHWTVDKSWILLI